MTNLKTIQVKGAREHNLKSINIEIPRNKLVLFTGLSGSGKSSLAIDTIYAEGQRRYVESLSAYARQFLNMMEKPDVDSISGLSPAISIEQKSTSRNPRSTVGTITEIHDYLRLLYARSGTPYSPATGLPIQAMQISDMVDQVCSLDQGTRFILLAPIVRERKGTFQQESREWLKQGFYRTRVDGIEYKLDNFPKLDKNKRHDIDLIVDRLVVDNDIENRLSDSLRTTLDSANGNAIIEIIDKKPIVTISLSENFACPVSGFTIPDIEPRMFSFNAHSGACPNCDGLGYKMAFDIDRIIPDKDLSLNKGAVKIWGEYPSKRKNVILTTLCKEFGGSMDTPWNMLTDKLRQIIIYGSGNIKIGFKFEKYVTQRKYEGLIPSIERMYRETTSNSFRYWVGEYQTSQQCQECRGYRLKPESLAIKIGGLHIGQMTELSISDALEWVNSVPEHLSQQKNTIAGSILKELHERLKFLVNVGLEYLTLSRSAGSLSGGESQRIRLASQIGSGLTGVLYVLDEPSIGLHQRDNKRLLDTLHDLRDKGNTVIVVEHDEEAIRSADFVVDFGPRAGVHGGQIVASGSPEQISSIDASLTGQYLNGSRKIDVPLNRRQGNGSYINIEKATANNLKNVNIHFPLGMFICVTGVSGSGKSSLTFEVLYSNLKSITERKSHYKGILNCHSIIGAEHIDKIIHIDQRPIGKTPRSNPVTYTKAFDFIRQLYAMLPESRTRGFKPGRFSFNVSGGRCEACNGDGVIKVSMYFLPDVYVKCDSCNGTRYNRQTLQVNYNGKNIADVLDMTVEEGEVFFRSFPTIHKRMATLNKVGLGYMKIGHPAPLLSGGESQRVKLARELAKTSTGRTLYLLDEPTTGLHFEDIKNLLGVLQELVDTGNTVIVIEHNLDVIKTADWLIDLGPEGGDKGGELVFSGPPEQIIDCQSSHTGRFLAEALSIKVTKAA